MAFKIITVPLPDPQERETEVNAFLSNHAVVGVQRHFIEKADEAFLVFVIEYVPGSAERAGQKEYNPTQPRKGKGVIAPRKGVKEKGSVL